MADHHEATHVSSAMDYKEHEATYRGFINISKWTVGILAVLMVVLYFVINP
jgi:Na+-transporting NADH:ubiquinone oxidoreductase subunit NqrB